MSKNSKRRMIRAAASQSVIRFDCGGIEWINAAEGDGADKPKRFSMVAYTGGPMVVGYYGVPVVIELSGLKAEAPIPILLNHDMGKLVGHAEQIDIGASTLKLSGVISGASPESAQVTASAGLGFPWKASVGARPDKMEFVGEDASVKVNGKTIKGPVYVARKATLGEVSFVAMAADSKTSAKVAARAAFSTGVQAMDFETWVQAEFCLDPTTLTEEQRAKLQAKFDASKKPEPVAATEPTATAKTIEAADPVAAMRSQTAAEATRIAAIQRIAGKHPDIVAKAITEGWTEDKTEVAVLKAELPKAPAIHASTLDTSAPVIEAAMCQSLKIHGLEKQFDDKTLQAAHTQFRGRLGLQQIILQAAVANGFPCGPGQRIHNGNLRDVIAYALPSDIRAAHASTINLSSIFSNVANKELLSGFMEEDQTWREIAVTRNVSDFKSVTSYRMLDDMEYEELPPDGQLKHGHVGEETYTRQAKTYAKMFALTRVDIVNDDMGALDDLRTRLGRGAARKFNKVFWAAFMDNSSFFTAARGNYISGATTTLLTDYVGLALAIAAFDNLKSPAVPPAKVGEKIGGTPTILMVPPELEATAMQIMAPIAATKASEVNIYSNRYKVLKVAQLSDSTYTGYSASAWYLLRNPQVLAAIVVSLLNGNANPIVESAEASFDRLGVEFRGYHDFGCDKAEYLCGVKSKGGA